MASYIFPWLNGSKLIINPTITKQGFSGGTFDKDISQGNFTVEIALKNSGGEWLVKLIDDTQPPDFTVEAIDIWIAEQLEKWEVSS